MGKPNSETLLGMGALDPALLRSAGDVSNTETRPSDTGVSGTHRSVSTHDVKDAAAPYSSLVDTRRGVALGHPDKDAPPSDMADTQPGLGSRHRGAQRLGTPVRVTTQNGPSLRPGATTLDTAVNPDPATRRLPDSAALTQDTLRGLGADEALDLNKTLLFAATPFPTHATSTARDRHVFTSAMNVTLPGGTRPPDSVAAAASERIRGVASKPPETPKVYVGRRTGTVELRAAERTTPVHAEPTPKPPEWATLPSRAAQPRPAEPKAVEVEVSRVEPPLVAAQRSSEETFRPSAHTTPPGPVEARGLRRRKWPRTFGLVAAGSLFVLGGASMVRVEGHTGAQGVVVLEGGLTPVLNEVAGPLLEVLVKPGDNVVVGQAIAEIDGSGLQQRRLELKEQEAALLAEKERAASVGSKLHNAATEALQRKRGVLWERLKLRKNAFLPSNGETTSEKGAKDVQARDAVLLIRQELADVEFELNRRQSDRDDQALTWERRMEDVHLALEQVNSLSPTVLSPATGRVDALLVQPGQVLTAGSGVARVSPDGAPTRILLAVPVATSQRLALGREVEVQFGSISSEMNDSHVARVSRIASENLTREQAAALLSGPLAEPLVEVEVELVPSEATAALLPLLHPGERVTARVPGEKRSLWRHLTQ